MMIILLGSRMIAVYWEMSIQVGSVSLNSVAFISECARINSHRPIQMLPDPYLEMQRGQVYLLMLFRINYLVIVTKIPVMEFCPFKD